MEDECNGTNMYFNIISRFCDDGEMKIANCFMKLDNIF